MRLTLVGCQNYIGFVLVCRRRDGQAVPGAQCGTDRGRSVAVPCEEPDLTRCPCPRHLSDVSPRSRFASAHIEHLPVVCLDSVIVIRFVLISDRYELE